MPNISRAGAAALAVAAALIASTANAADARRETAGKLADGSTIEAVTLTSGHGVSARILSYGATLQSLIAPDRDGRLADIVLGYDDAATYQNHPSYLGATIGRYANRIAGGAFALDGKTYRLPLNDKTNTLHGGGKGFDKQAWRIVSVTSGPVASVVLALSSPDGDAGYPGTLDATVTYALDESGALKIRYDASTTKPTVVNMTNHSFFNLAGEGAPAGATFHTLMIPARAYTPVDRHLIPTGERRAVDGTVFDFRLPRVIAEGIRDGRDAQIRYGRGYDHNFALDKGLTKTPELAARLEDPASGRVLEVLSTEPGVQVYTGNFLDGTFIGKHGHVYRMGDSVSLEPQKFPDAPNHPDFVAARVDPGTPYQSEMIFRLSVAPR